MRRTLTLTTALIAAAAVAPGVAVAQQQPTNGAGLRYLSWPGKAAVAHAPVAAVGETPAARPTRVSAPVPLARIAPAPSPVTTSRGLTPASAWLGSTARPAAASPAPAPEPIAPAPAVERAAAPAPLPQPAEAAPPPAPQLPPPPPAAQEAAVDPMAPRRDAPIFRLQRPDGTTTGAPQAGAAASGQNARYYSVHRQAGHEPDAIRTPAPVYLDALPVQMAQTPTSTDLAQPDAPPTLLRGTDGKVRALPQTEADELP